MGRLVLSTRSRTLLGAFGEALAAHELRRHQIKITARNWRCSKGEIDAVAIDRRTLVLVEVKTRESGVSRYFDPVRAVDQHKRRKLAALAQVYSRQALGIRQRQRLHSFRIDIIAVTVGMQSIEIRHLRGEPVKVRV